MEPYTSVPPQQTFVGETVIEKSRFIATLQRADSVEEAVEFVARMRKKYYDATHNCYAYVVDGAVKFSDDGEPGGTAGLPMYEVLRRQGLNRVCVVVTRYFGGIKLGAGGLVRAYGGAVADVLGATPRLNYVWCTRAKVVVDYSLFQPVKRAVAAYCKVQDVCYDDKVTLTILCKCESSTTISDIVTEITAGKGVFEPKEQLLEAYEQKETV